MCDTSGERVDVLVTKRAEPAAKPKDRKLTVIYAARDVCNPTAHLREKFSSSSARVTFNTEIAMAEERITDAGYDQEDAYFYQKDAELLAKRRAELDAQRSVSTAGKLECPRCGSEMNEVAFEQVEVERCTGCGGVFLDKGELEMLTLGKAGRFVKRFFGT